MTILGHPLGVQLLAEIWECDKHKLDDINGIQDIMVSTASIADAEIREVVFHRFEPHGVSGVVW